MISEFHTSGNCMLQFRDVQQLHQVRSFNHQEIKNKPFFLVRFYSLSPVCSEGNAIKLEP